MNLIGRPVLTFVIALALSAGAAAHEYKTKTIKIVHPRAHASLPGATTGAAFMRIVNGGGKSVRLLSATTPVAEKIEIHTMSVTKGVMRMRPMTKPLVVPARGEVKFKSGDLHFMLVGLKAPLVEEDLVPVTLNFERGLKFDIELYIEAGAAPHAAHRH